MKLPGFARPQVISKPLKLGATNQPEAMLLVRRRECFLLTAPTCEGQGVSGRNKDIDGVTVTSPANVLLLLLDTSLFVKASSWSEWT